MAQTTTKNYEIKVAGIKVGQFTATEIKEATGQVTYAIDSKVNVNFLVYKMNTTFVSKSKYQHGTFVNARVDMVSNKGDFYTETKKTKTGYHIKGEHQNGLFENVINESVSMSIAKLYFVEPTKETKVYAEYYGGFMKIKKLENGVYHGRIDENEDTFYYKDGNLIKTEKKNGYKNLEFIYVNTTTEPRH